MLLLRTPYDKARVGRMTLDVERATARGYICVIQDTRGRFASDGDFDPFRAEVEDGYDTVEWAAKRPGADGRVAMYGGSYMGLTQWAAAVATPPSLVTITPATTSGDPYAGWVYSGGGFQLHFHMSWVHFLAADTAERRGVTLPATAEFNRLWLGQNQALLDGDARAAARLGEEAQKFVLTEASRLPLAGYPAFREVAPFYDTWLTHPFRDAYWDLPTVDAQPERVGVPVLHIAGWYDLFLDAQLKTYTRLRALAGPEGAARHRLVVGPWVHGRGRASVCGEMEMGPESVLDLEGLQLAWFDRWLKGEGRPDEAPVRLFVMGLNRWRDEREWPLARAVPTDFFLHSGGGANTLHGDGTLDRTPPEREEPDAFVYDPAAPVPTLGGNTFIIGGSPGVYDQRPVERREDVLVYTSAPLTADLEVTGPVRAHLWAATDGPDTDFAAKLVDVHPDGYAANLCDGLLRSTHRAGDRAPARTEPGVPYEYVIELGPTSNVFRAGHRIRLEVSSSNFPRFDRNPNTGAPPATATELRPARQIVFHELDMASRLVLPIVSD